MTERLRVHFMKIISDVLFWERIIFKLKKSLSCQFSKQYVLFQDLESRQKRTFLRSKINSWYLLKTIITDYKKHLSNDIILNNFNFLFKWSQNDLISSHTCRLCHCNCSENHFSFHLTCLNAHIDQHTWFLSSNQHCLVYTVYLTLLLVLTDSTTAITWMLTFSLSHLS